MSSNIIEVMKKTSLYRDLLEQVPEEQRDDAIRALEEQLKPYDALCAAVPPGAFEKLVSSLNLEKIQADLVKSDTNRRAPRRF
jgi:hypothetical protein